MYDYLPQNVCDNDYDKVTTRSQRFSKDVTTEWQKCIRTKRNRRNANDLNFLNRTFTQTMLDSPHNRHFNSKLYTHTRQESNVKCLSYKHIHSTCVCNIV